MKKRCNFCCIHRIFLIWIAHVEKSDSCQYLQTAQYRASCKQGAMPVLESWYRAEGWRGTGIISPSSESNYRLTIDFGVMPVLNQYRSQCWVGTDVLYRASTDGQFPAKLTLGAAPVVGRAYAGTMPVPR